MKSKICLFFATILLFSQCKNDPKSGDGNVVDPSKDPKAGVAFAVNLLGNKLQEWKDTDSLKQSREAYIEQSRTVYLSKLEDPKGYIQYGRAFVANGQVENAIELYSKGIEKFPEVADLYLYRGEAMLLGRQLTGAIDNFWKSGQKMEKISNPKGLTGMWGTDSIADMTLQFKNYLLMGLAFQCNNDFSSADKMFEVCGDFSTNTDLWVRSYYWQYQCYTRSGRSEDVKNILNAISKDMHILPSSKAYHDAMLFYKGEISEKALVDLTNLPNNIIDAEDWAIKAYALGYKYQLDNKKEKAAEIFRTIMSSGYWTLLPCLAAEAELSHMQGIEYKEPEQIELKTQQKKKPVRF